MQEVWIINGFKWKEIEEAELCYIFFDQFGDLN